MVWNEDLIVDIIAQMRQTATERMKVILSDEPDKLKRAETAAACYRMLWRVGYDLAKKFSVKDWAALLAQDEAAVKPDPEDVSVEFVCYDKGQFDKLKQEIEAKRR